jgi:hypothetical protein
MIGVGSTPPQYYFEGIVVASYPQAGDANPAVPNMTHFDNEAPVLNQTGIQNIYGAAYLLVPRDKAGEVY